MKRFTLIQALQHIEIELSSFDGNITGISTQEGVGNKFTVEHGNNTYHISLSDTGIVNSIIKLES